MSGDPTARYNWLKLAGFAAVILIAWFFGFGPAVLAAALGGAVLRYVAGQTGRWQLDGRDAGWLLLFGVTVLATAWLASTVRRLEDERRYLLARERGGSRRCRGGEPHQGSSRHVRLT